MCLKESSYNSFGSFWALPDKHLYMAVGAYRQLIMVFPDLDVVAGSFIFELRGFKPAQKDIQGLAKRRGLGDVA
jgi:hypothetical protein